MRNNLTFLSNPVKRVQLLIHLTLWTFSVDSCIKGFQAKTGVREGKIYTPNVIKHTILLKICTFVPLQ